MQPEQNIQNNELTEPTKTEHSQEVHVPPSHMQPQPPTRAEAIKGFKPLLVLLAIIISLAVALGLYRLLTEQSNDINQNLTTEERLEGDLNALGLGLNNYIERNDSFELTTKSEAELRISFLPQEFNDPRTNEQYVITQAIPKEGELQYIRGGICSSDGSIRSGGGDNSYAIRALIDADTFSCLHSSEVREPKLPDAQTL